MPVLGTGSEMHAQDQGLLESLHALCHSKNEVFIGSTKRACSEQGLGSDIGGQE